MEDIKMLEVGEEARRFVALNFAVLNRDAAEVCLNASGRGPRKTGSSTRTIVELDRLVGGGACLILGGFFAEPKMEVVGENIRVWTFLVSIEDDI